MYLEIKDLTEKERDILQNMFCDRLRPIHSIYYETCRIEADCTLDRVEGYEYNEEDHEMLLDKLAEEIANDCEDTVFQEMCERADEIVARHFAK